MVIEWHHHDAGHDCQPRGMESAILVFNVGQFLAILECGGRFSFCVGGVGDAGENQGIAYRMDEVMIAEVTMFSPEISPFS